MFGVRTIKVGRDEHFYRKFKGFVGSVCGMNWMYHSGVNQK